MFRDFHDKYKCIFIHVPKVAGTSIERVIFQTNTWLVGHVKAIDYINLDKDRFNSYFSFGFVRNPYDRVVSAYYYLKNSGGNTYDEKWAKENIYKYNSFEEFVLNFQNDNEQIKILNWQHFTPQYKYLCDDNKNILVNFIGKFENINDDFNEILSILNIKRTLVHTNKSKHLDYKNYYNNKTYAIIREIYKDDFEIFDYDMEDKSIYFIDKEDCLISYQCDKIKNKNTQIKNLRLEIFHKNNKLEKEKFQIKTLNEINSLLSFQTKHGTAKARIQNQLSYKLGQTLIINSKSIFGILCMPIYIISTIINHNQEQKIYKAKIKKDPSLKLPPLENYPDYKEALKEKECLTYKLGQALIKANKTWYKGGYIKLWFEIRKLKKGFVKN
ncbi:sulfotransferase family protein [Campylobacter jejuni]|nr:sulfotransferase family protein [Campylobacter jejuni]